MSKPPAYLRVTLQILATDQRGVLSIFSLRAGRLLATRRMCHSPLVCIRPVLGR